MMTESDRISRLEGIVESTDARLRSIDTRIDSLESRMDSRFDSLESRMDSRFNNLETKMITLWVTTILAILAGFISIWFRG